MVRSFNEELGFLERINQNCWRIKKGFVPNMKVSLLQSADGRDAESLSVLLNQICKSICLRF